MRNNHLANRQLRDAFYHHMQVLGVELDCRMRTAINTTLANIACAIDEYGYAPSSRPPTRQEIEERLMVSGVESLHVYRLAKSWWCRAEGARFGISMASANTPLDAIVAVVSLLNRDEVNDLSPVLVAIPTVTPRGESVSLKAVTHIDPAKRVWSLSQVWIDGTKEPYRPSDAEVDLIRRRSLEKLDEYQRQYLTDEYGIIAEVTP